MSANERALAKPIVSEVKRLHVPIDESEQHPLLRYAFIDERQRIQWPTLTMRQRLVAGQTVTLSRVNGSLVFSLPPRVNADWFIPANSSDEDLRTVYGSVADVRRWYLSIDLALESRDALLVAALNVDGQRAFFACSPSSNWLKIPSRTFTSWRDSSDFMLAPTDVLAAAAWRRKVPIEDRETVRQAAERVGAVTHKRPDPPTKEYWQARYNRTFREIEVIKLEMLIDLDGNRDKLEAKRRRLSFDLWNISKRVSDFA